MSIEIGSAYVSIIPSTKGMARTLDAEFSGASSKIGKKAGQNIGGGITSSLKGLGGVALGALGAIGFGQLASEAVTATDATSKFKQTLNFAGLDTGKIDELTAATQKYADATVYSLSDIQNITAQLAANAVPNYDRLAEAAGNLNAAAGGNAATFQSVGMVLTQTAGVGKLTTENWNQLADAIPGASGLLQEAMKQNGAYTGNFREAMEKGQITAEEFNQAIMDLGFTDAAAQAATSTATFEGAMGNLQATVVGGLAGILASMQPQITGLINTVSGALEPVFSFITANMPTIISFCQGLIPVLAGLTAGFIAFKAATAISAAVTAVTTVFAALTAGTGALTISQKLLWAVFNMNPFVKIATLIGVVVTALVGLWTTNEDFRNAVTSAWEFIQNTAGVVFGAISSTISTIFNSILSVATSVWNAIQTAIQNPIETAKNIVKGAIDAIKGFFSFKISWPKIPMPHFSVSPSGWQIGDLLKGVIPSLGISFYAQGGIVDTPHLGVVGEAGAEAIVPLTPRRLKPFAEAVAGQLDGGSGSTTNIFNINCEAKDLEDLMTWNDFVQRFSQVNNSYA